MLVHTWDLLRRELAWHLLALILRWWWRHRPWLLSSTHILLTREGLCLGHIVRLLWHTWVLHAGRLSPGLALLGHLQSRRASLENDFDALQLRSSWHPHEAAVFM